MGVVRIQNWISRGDALAWAPVPMSGAVPVVPAAMRSAMPSSRQPLPISEAPPAPEHARAQGEHCPG